VIAHDPLHGPEKALDVSVKSVVHLLLQKHVRQLIQRIMLAAPRTESIGEAERVLFVDLVEEAGHGLLDDFVFQGRRTKIAISIIGGERV